MKLGKRHDTQPLGFGYQTMTIAVWIHVSFDHPQRSLHHLETVEGLSLAVVRASGEQLRFEMNGSLSWRSQ